MSSTLHNILIVDDESSLRNLLSLALKSVAESSDTACDGLEALRKMAENHYDVIIADISMPRLSGLEFLEKVRESGDETPVILCSAHFPDEAFTLAERYRSVQMMSKPMSLPAIRQLVLEAGQREAA